MAGLLQDKVVVISGVGPALGTTLALTGLATAGCVVGLAFVTGVTHAMAVVDRRVQSEDRLRRLADAGS